MEVDKAFFDEETRCGHTVTSQVKKLWAVQIDCLEQLKQICERHNIRYFVSGGTLLGAIRHKGYIPWDDDLDVVMFKDDYDRFCEVAPYELSQPYFFQNYKTQEGASPGMTRIRNSNTTSCTMYEYDMVDENYNCGVFIDVFPMYGVERSKGKRLWQMLRMGWGRMNIAAYELHRKAFLTGDVKRYLNPLVWWWQLAKLFTSHQRIGEKYLAACSSAKEYDEVGLLSFSGFDKRWIWKKEWYEGSVQKPFEYTEVSVPQEYDKILRQQFGDYNVFKKGGSVHTMAILDPDVPYKEKLKDLLPQRINRQ